MSDEGVTGKARGGFARAETLSPEKRQEIARRAALSRWGAHLPAADFEGEFPLGETPVSCAVLADGTRIITQATFLRALGRSRSPKAGTGVLSTVDELPFFLRSDVLKPFISHELVRSTKPLFYRTKTGGKGVGYDARLLPQVAEVYLKYRDAVLAGRGDVPGRYQGMVVAADLLMRALANVGIIALVDEATGYQEVRSKQALQAILDAYLRKELAAWAKRFPDEFYQQIFRLRGWSWKGRGTNPPQVVAGYTKDIVYSRLAPGIIEELEKKNPSESGKRRAKHHQWLTEDVGHPALAQHLHAVITLMRISTSWDQFKLFLDQAHPKRGDTMLLPLMIDVSRKNPAEKLPLFEHSPDAGQP
jgi:P63C domain